MALLSESQVLCDFNDGVRVLMRLSLASLPPGHDHRRATEFMVNVMVASAACLGNAARIDADDFATMAHEAMLRVQNVAAAR